jgi:Uma2 family endonuclease
MEGKDAMPSSAERRRLTYDDFLLFPDDGMRHELIDGEHYVTPCPNTRHQELAGRLTRQNVQGPPALVIEIQSPSTRKRDETIKRQLFERGGVREYWLVDPDDNTIRVFRRTAAGELPPVADLGVDDTLTTPLLPDFALPLADFSPTGK